MGLALLLHGYLQLCVDGSRVICSAARGGASVHRGGENGLGSCVHGREPQRRGRLLVVRMSQSGEGLVFYSWPARPTREPIK